MNKTEAAAKINEMHAAAMAEVHEVGKPYAVNHVTANGATVGAVRIAGAVRFKVNGVYQSRAKALAALEGAQA